MKNKMCRILFPVLVLGVMAAGQPGISGAGEAYDPFGRRDPFVPLVGVGAKIASGGLQNVVSVEDIYFQGIILGANGERYAVVNDEIFREGDRTGMVTIESVGKDNIKVRINDEQHLIKLYE